VHPREGSGHSFAQGRRAGIGGHLGNGVQHIGSHVLCRLLAAVAVCDHGKRHLLTTDLLLENGKGILAFGPLDRMARVDGEEVSTV
jgi:hypothetical protein